MSDWPSLNNFPLDSSGVFSTATALIGGLNTTGAFVSTAWPSANLAVFVPIRVASPCVVYKMAIGAGATAAGNFDVGIYDANGNKLVSSGSTAKGSSTEQIIDVTDTFLGHGLYYLALAADATGNYIAMTPTGTSPVPVQKARLAGTLEMATAFALPTTATFATRSVAIIPAIAAYLRAA